MYKRLSTYLEQNNILYDYQFGFRKNYSTSQAVMEVMDNIHVYQYCSNRELIMGIYIDLLKAFDTVNHLILIQKLEKYGVRGLILDWFRSYLNNRKQYTVILDHQSILQTY